MVGYPNWVGKSSLEISVDLYAGDEKLLESTFCMVAKDQNTRKPVMINPLIPETEEEKAIFQKGQENKARRALERQQSLKIEAPTVEERLVLHEIFMTNKSAVQYNLIGPTSFETLDFCQASAKNVSITTKSLVAQHNLWWILDEKGIFFGIYDCLHVHQRSSRIYFHG
jgi:hypothetical protein